MVKSGTKDLLADQGSVYREKPYFSGVRTLINDCHSGESRNPELKVNLCGLMYTNNIGRIRLPFSRRPALVR